MIADVQDEETFQPKLFVSLWTQHIPMEADYQYAKLPEDISERYVLLLDPMLGKLTPL
jgi:uracil phosphoribosyltransferase